MKKKYGYLTGYSDHTIGDHNAIAAVALGAKVIEKHFTLSQKMVGPDHKFAIEPLEFGLMVKKIREIESGMGDGAKKGPRTEEMEMYKKGRRSIHFNKNLSKGSIIKKTDLVIKRPGLGIIPSKVNKIIGKKLKKSAKERAEMTSSINQANAKHDKIRETLKKLYPFNTGVRITRNDIIKYKLWSRYFYTLVSRHRTTHP